MRHRVVMLARAEADAEEIFAWLAAQSRGAAERWFESLAEACRGLEHMPNSRPPAREGRLHGHDLRQLLLGRYRVVFFVDRDTVKIVTIRHVARLPARLDEL